MSFYTSNNAFIPGGAPGGVLFVDPASPNPGAVTTDSFFTFDPTNDRLRIWSTGIGAGLDLGAGNMRISLTGNFGIGIGTQSGTSYFNVGTLGAGTDVSGLFTNLAIGGTSSNALVDISGSWNTTGTATGLKINVTDTASNAASLLIDVQLGGSSQLVLNKSGNLGIGVTPQTWGSNYKAIEVAGASAGVVSAYVNNLNLGTNIRNDNTNWIYAYTGQNATRYQMNASGQHAWFTAPSGTAGNVISFTQAMTLDGTDLRIGGTLGTTPSLTKGVYLESSTNNAVIGYSLYVNDGANNRRGSMFLDDANGLWGWDVTSSSGTPDYVWRIATFEQMRLTSTGLGIGKTPTVKLDVQGIANFYSGAAGVFNFINVGRTASEARMAVAAAANDFLSNTAAGDTLFYCVASGNSWYGVAGTGAAVFVTNNSERARITSTGNVVAGGSVALATTATDGFLYVPTCAGIPTGTPTAITGMAPVVVNTAANKLYFYSGGAWRDAGP